MFNFKNKKDDTSILDDIRFKPRNIEENIVDVRSKKINYLKIKHSKYIKFALIFCLISFLLSYISIKLTIYYKGNPKLYISAIVLYAIVFIIYSLIYTYKAFKDKNKRIILNYLCLLLSGIELIFWIVIIIVGV